MSHYSGWGFDWEDRVITIQGNKVKIETQLSEFVDEVLAQRHALTLARTVKSNTPIMLKITCELNPKYFPLIDDVEETQRVADKHIDFEADLIDLVHSIGHGPRLLKYVGGKQKKWMPYPGGRISYKVLTRVPGEDPDEIRRTLSRQQRQSIRSQLAKILEAMADKNRILRSVDPSFLRYDKGNDKLYLVDLTHWCYQIVEYEITEDSPFVLEFGLWSEEDLATDETDSSKDDSSRENLPFRSRD